MHKGAGPLYYVNNVPTLRHLTSSRPAEPQEVIDKVAYRRTDELQSEAAERGLELLRAVTYSIGFRDDVTRAVIAKQARRLREVETPTIYMDGGKAIDDIVATVKDGAAQLTTIEISLDH